MVGPHCNKLAHRKGRVRQITTNNEFLENVFGLFASFLRFHVLLHTRAFTRWESQARYIPVKLPRLVARLKPLRKYSSLPAADLT